MCKKTEGADSHCEIFYVIIETNFTDCVIA